MSLICDFDREIETTTREIEEQAKADDRVEVLTQIRGVGRYTAMLIIAEIGDITPLPDRAACLLLGLAWHPACAALTAKPAGGTSPAKAHPRCAGRWSKPRRRSPPEPGPLREKFERIGAQGAGDRVIVSGVGDPGLTGGVRGRRDRPPGCPGKPNAAITDTRSDTDPTTVSFDGSASKASSSSASITSYQWALVTARRRRTG